MKPKVAFICVHNSCRSQIAEALGKHFAWDVFENQTLRLTCTNIFDKEFIISSSGYINPERKIIASWECKF